MSKTQTKAPESAIGDTNGDKNGQPAEDQQGSARVIDFMWTEHLSGLEVKTKWPRGRNATIDRVTIGEVFDQQMNAKKEMVIAFFEGIERGLVVNKTNLRFLAKKFGGDDKLWIGQSVSLLATKRSNGSTGVDLDDPI